MKKYFVLLRYRNEGLQCGIVFKNPTIRPSNLNSSFTTQQLDWKGYAETNKCDDNWGYYWFEQDVAFNTLSDAQEKLIHDLFNNNWSK